MGGGVREVVVVVGGSKWLLEHVLSLARSFPLVALGESVCVRVCCANILAGM